MFSKNHINFKSFNDVESTMLALGNFIYDKKIRFQKPSKPVLWERTLTDCAYFLKVVLSINTLDAEFKNRYRIVYKRPLFWEQDMYSIMRDKNSYDIIIKSYFNYRLYDVQYSFKCLMGICERELPKYEFDKLYAKLEVIANRTLYKY